MRALMAVLVVGLFLITIIVVIVTLATGSEADYARLDPAPDSIVWEEGHETTLWLETNRHWADLRIASVAMGLGDIKRAFPESGETLDLGRGEGCLQWAVAGLSVYSIGDVSGGGKNVGVQGTVDRNGTTGQLVVHVRMYELGASPANSIAATVASGSESFSQTRVINPVGDNNMWVIEASKNDRFPKATTRTITVPVDDVETAVTITDDEAEAIRVLQDRGVGLIACSEADDVMVTLHGKDGEELNRYLVDVEPDPPPAARVPPQSTEPYIPIQVCVDADNARADYLDGGEYAGDALDASDFGLTGAILSAYLTETEAGNNHLYFFASQVTGGDVQLSISDAGAGDTLGLDADRVYPVRVTATADNGTTTAQASGGADATSDDETASIDVGVWLDTSTLSPNDDGLCS